MFFCRFTRLLLPWYNLRGWIVLVPLTISRDMSSCSFVVLLDYCFLDVIYGVRLSFFLWPFLEISPVVLLYFYSIISCLMLSTGLDFPCSSFLGISHLVLLNIAYALLAVSTESKSELFGLIELTMPLNLALNLRCNAKPLGDYDAVWQSRT